MGSKEHSSVQHGLEGESWNAECACISCAKEVEASPRLDTEVDEVFEESLTEGDEGSDTSARISEECEGAFETDDGETWSRLDAEAGFDLWNTESSEPDGDGEGSDVLATISEECEAELDADDAIGSAGRIESGTDAQDRRVAEVANEWEVFLPHALDRPQEYMLSTSFERVMREPTITKPEEVRDRPNLLVVDEKDEPITDGEYVFHQGELHEGGKFSNARMGRAYFGKIDITRPFVFEVRDRVCAIRAGAFFNPDDPKIEYGGTWFDWTLVRDNKDAAKNFWPYYQREMDLITELEASEATLQRRVDRFLQHEHITRRPISIAKPFLAQLSKVRIRAVPVRIRVGPFVRYTDHERAVIWLETVTPSMVRVRYKRAGGNTESSRYTSTVRVGGRHFAAVEIVGLKENEFYDYTIELAPLPASGVIPVDKNQKDFEHAFPTLTPRIASSMKNQLAVAALKEGSEWLTFRTLRSKYDDKLRFATGSCRWYPGDKKGGKDWGPDMLNGLGDWLRLNPKDKWPSFLFFGGDQIYSDEIGDDHGEMLIRGRFASRIPGPVDPAGSVRGKLIDGAWAGRFSHRYKAYKDPDMKFVERVRGDLKELDESYRKYPEIKDIYHRYPKTGATDKENRVLAHQLMSGLTWGLGGKVSDQKTYTKALSLLQSVNKLNLRSGSYRAFAPHWAAGFSIAVRRNPMAHRYLSHNFLLWEIPNFEPLLPTVSNASNGAIVGPNVRGHLPAAGGRHAADFAEYAYLYERAWTTSRSVRVLLAQVPTFLMFDDHEVTDDWNFDVSWVRMLHNEKDDFRMWPKTLTDSLAAYWMYQGWCNRAPSQWQSNDPRVEALIDAQLQGTDALPKLRKCIHSACFMPAPPKDSKTPYQTGLSLDWHYKLPFDPPFLVPDCRTRKYMVPADDGLRIIDHDASKERPMSQTIDNAQLTWMRNILFDKRRTEPVVFIAPSTPLLMQKKAMDVMMRPETTAELWNQFNLPSLVAAASDSTKLGTASGRLLRVFRRTTDLEHMIRDKSWLDVWGLVEAMREKGSPVKTLVLVSGDVHHNYAMTANLAGGGRPKPELLQITCSGLQTTIRSEFPKTSLGEELGNLSFNVGKYRLVPGFISKNGTGKPDLVLYENAVALVDVNMTPEVNVGVTYLAGGDQHSYRYTSAATYMKGAEPAFTPWRTEMETQPSRHREDEHAIQGSDLESPFLGELFVTKRANMQTHVDRICRGSSFSEESEVMVAGEASRREEFLGWDKSERWPQGEDAYTNHEQHSFEPGQSILVDGHNLRTYVDAVAWYEARRDILLGQKRAFVKDGYLVPDGLDDLVVAANARIKMMRKRGSQPMSDSHVEGTLGWFDVYLKIMYACDQKMEGIAVDRYRATQAAIEKLKEQISRLQPQLREFQRSAFRNGSKNKLKQGAEAFATMLDSVLVAKQWTLDAASKLEDIRVLGTTLRTQKALHGSSQPWHELMRKTTNAKIAKLLSVADGLNKALAVWQLFDASIVLLSGGKTSSDRASAGISLAATAASAGGTLLGASGFFSLYTNLYIGPMVKRILGQIDQLKDRISTGRNRPYIQLGHLDQVDWSLEPGGREMYEFMRGVMRARAISDIGAMPAAVSKYFSKYRGTFDAGTPKRNGVDIDYADFDDKREWAFAFRDDIWGMLYGSMPV